MSDFRDYYDPWFDRDGQEFHRVSTGGPFRSEMFRLFDGMNIPTPRHGLVKDMPPDVKWMVVYLDESLHRGDGKILISATEARQAHPGVFCAEYLAWPDNEPRLSHKGKIFGSSWRRLIIGFRSYWMHYINCDDWRSNVGDDVKIELEKCEERPQKKDFKYPLYAIDYVFDDRKSNFVAVDLNIAPGFGGTEVQDELPPQQVIYQLKAWITLNFKPTAV